MSNRVNAKSQSKYHASGDVQARRLALFGRPPLISGEKAAAYDELFTRVCDAVKPVNIIEEIFVGDVVDLAWDVARLRRLKADFLDAGAWDQLAPSIVGTVAIRGLDHLGRIEHLIALAESRCIAILREIDRHRATLAGALRQTIQEIDGEFKALEAPTGEDEAT